MPREADKPIVLTSENVIIVPAKIYFLITHDNSFISQGWAIPTATDIALSLGVLSLFGKRVPMELKIFLAALAIFDDLGGIRWWRGVVRELLLRPAVG